MSQKTSLPHNDIDRIINEISDRFKTRNIVDIDKQHVAMKKWKYFVLRADDKTCEIVNKKKDGLKDRDEVFETLIEAAKIDYYSYCALAEICADWLDSKKDLPLPVRNWVIKFLKNPTPPTKKLGKKLNINLQLFATFEVIELLELGFPAGKNDVTNTQNNAFSIVAQAAKKAGLKSVSYTSIKDYFYSMQHLR